jgi:hypothetical protein
MHGHQLDECNWKIYNTGATTTPSTTTCNVTRSTEHYNNNCKMLTSSTLRATPNLKARPSQQQQGS